MKGMSGGGYHFGEKSCIVSSLVYVLNKTNTTDKLGKIECTVMAFNQKAYFIPQNQFN